MNAALVRASHHDWRWHHNKTSQQSANCMNGWCKVGQGTFKTVWESPSSPLVLKLATLSGATGETLRAEWSRLSMLCSLEAGMISHRVPWSAEPFRASANAPEMLAQARITGHVIRIRSGASFYGALPLLWEDPTSSLPRSSASEGVPKEERTSSQRAPSSPSSSYTPLPPSTPITVIRAPPTPNLSRPEPDGRGIR